MPGRKTSTSPDSSLSAWRTAHLSPVRAGSLHHRQPTHVDVVGTTDALDHRGVTEHAAQSLATSGVADMARIRRSGRTVARASSAKSQTKVGRNIALVNLVEDHQPYSGQLGVALQPTGENTFGHDLDPRRGQCGVRRGSGIRRGRRTSSPSSEAIRCARGRVARRRGSSITMRSSNHGRRSAQRRDVVLPAPGGATSSAVPIRQGCRQLRQESTTGSRGCGGQNHGQPRAGVP